MGGLKIGRACGANTTRYGCVLQRKIRSRVHSRKGVLCKTGFKSPKFVARLWRAKIVGDEFVLAQSSITSVNTRAANRTMYRSVKRIHYTHIIVGNNQMILAAALRIKIGSTDPIV